MPTMVARPQRHFKGVQRAAQHLPPPAEPTRPGFRANALGLGVANLRRRSADYVAMLDRFDEAVPLAQEANAKLRDLDGRRFGEGRLAEIAISAGDHERTDGLEFQGAAWCDLAEVLHAAGRREEAAAALAEALERYERKRNTPMARRTRERLAALPGSRPRA